MSLPRGSRPGPVRGRGAVVTGPRCRHDARVRQPSSRSGYDVTSGRLDASEAEILEAVRRARLDDMVADLPEGLDTLIGERGVKLSGGQQQRLAIAHRLATVQHADSIVVVDDGRVVEQGRHVDLLARSGAYRRLHDAQFGPLRPSALPAD